MPPTVQAAEGEGADMDGVNDEESKAGDASVKMETGEDGSAPSEPGAQDGRRQGNNQTLNPLSHSKSTIKDGSRTNAD